ncbi:MAG: hypothetical protein ACK5PP_16380 [Acidimicrobiales bacterium]
MESFSRFLKGTILALLVVLMVLLAVLALVSLSGLRDAETDQTAAVDPTASTATGEGEPEGPPATAPGAGGTVPLGPDADGSAACVRTGSNGGFVVRVVNPSGEVEATAVGVRLTMGDNSTVVHTVTVAADEAGTTGEATVPDSQTALACMVTSTQRGNRVTITGN